MNNIEYLDYAPYGKLINILGIQCIPVCKEHNLKYIYGIPRGGLPIAVHLAHSLNLTFISELSKDRYPVLIVDDVADSGKTLRKILRARPAYRGSMQTATLFYKHTSIIIPDCYVKVTDKWVVFPWESDILLMPRP